MPSPFFVDEFSDRIDSLYRLVIVGERRANQIKVEQAGFTGVHRAEKTTTQALEEVIEGKLSWAKGDTEEETFFDISD